MEKAAEIQQQVRHNADDLQNYMRDLMQWKEEMKKKDEELKADIVPEEQSLPPIRSRKTHKKAKIDVVSSKNKKNKKTEEPVVKMEIPPKRISSYDYAAWDKFDVDKACEELDEDEKKKENEDEDDSDESEDENYEELRRKDQAIEEKEKGNECLKMGNIDEAIQHYTNGMLCDPVNPIIPANRAMALLKKEFFAAAEQDCDIAIALDKTYVKAFHRRGTARTGLKKYESAREDFQEVLKLEPGNKQALFEIRKINMLLREMEAAEKAPPATISEENIEKSKVGRRIKIIEVEGEDETEENAVASPPQHDNEPVLLKEHAEISPKEECIKGRVYPIEKPPHLRSKKPLQKIEIEEVESDEELGKGEGEKGEPATMKLRNQEEPLKLQTSGGGDAVQATENSNIKNEEVDLSHTNLEQSPVSANKDNIESQLETETKVDIPCCPLTSFQFQADWKKLQRNPEALYLYIKQIPSKDYAQIFQQCLESDMLSDMLKTYRYFIRDGLDIAEPLQSLTSIKRFGTLILFLSGQDKENLKELFSHLESNKILSTDEITTLKRKYGI